jgi:hypothetical protein
MGISLVKISETRWTKSCDVPFFFMTSKFHTSQHPMKTVFKMTDALEKGFQQDHQHPTQMTLLLNFSILSCQCQNFMTWQIMVPEQS